MDQAVIVTPLGLLELSANTKGLCGVKFINQQASLSPEIPVTLKEAAVQLQEYFARERKKFDLTLAPEGTDFQQEVWQKLLEVPYGKTRSYLDIAKQMGDQKVIRAAASANGKNPIAIIIPCHRIIGSDGSLTGYAGGLTRKKQLLDLESNYTQGRLF